VIQERKLKWRTESKPASAAEIQDSLVGRKKRLAFLDLLIEASDDGKQLTDLDIREEVDTFMFEGHDTTAVAISWSLFALALFPHIQNKVLEELISLLEYDKTAPITIEHTQQMKYLECEALRYAPSVPFLARKIKEDIVMSGYVVPAGVTAVIIVPFVHQHPDSFPDPTLFNPDKFLPENTLNRHPYSYIPFSAGSRNCIGQRFALLEEKVVLAWILRSFKIETRQDFYDIQVLFYQIPYTTTNLMITNSCNPGWELGYLLRAGAKWHGRRNPGDHKDPAGVTTAIIIPILHNHPDSFSDPAQFNPDSRIKYWSVIDKIPGPPTLPIIGNGWDLVVDHSDLPNLFWKWNEMFPKRCKVWLLGYPYLIIYSPADVEVILSNPIHNDKSDDYKFLQPWLGTGLLTSAGAKWHGRRKLLTPAFHFRILEDFMSVFNNQSKILITKLMAEKKQEFDIVPVITMCTLDIICDSVMGCHINAQHNSESAYIIALEKIKDIIHSRQLRFYLWSDWLFNLSPPGRQHAKCLKILHEFTDKVIQERKLKWKSESKSATAVEMQDSLIGRKKRLTFLDLLIEASDDGKQLTDLDIREEVDTFMFEGHDTTAVAISWSLFALASFPHIQNKVHEELDSIFEDNKTAPITTEHTQQMKYMECEALRFVPSVPVIARKIKEDTVMGGYKVPAGVTTAIIVPVVHRQTESFPDPDSFDPDRFLPENTLNRHPYSYIPFSAGSRNCIGQRFALLEEKVVLAWILRSFKIQSRHLMYEIPVVTELILKPKDGIITRMSMLCLGKLSY
uniref:Cytochrome P450 n=1 Tax=Strigamia maritima TaxID=126957 RepID=T1IX38_STRMM